MGSGRDVERGYPHLADVRASITALYRRLSPDGLRPFAVGLPPVEVAFFEDEELYAGAQRVAGAVVRHLRLPQARVIVGFRDMEQAALVEPAAGPEYFVELNSRFKGHRRDIGAALAHEVTHVQLHRWDLRFEDEGANEILTDTAAAYLGSGWLLLDAFRQDALTSQKLGYLTPEEFGYVLAKRAEVFGEDPEAWFTSPQAGEAYRAGRALARRDGRRPPLLAAGRLDRARYVRDRGLAGVRGAGAAAAPGGGSYAFEGPVGSRPSRVSFGCPVCFQRLALPVRGRVRARCGLCRTVLECDT